jgi:hypothetical protein
MKTTSNKLTSEVVASFKHVFALVSKVRRTKGNRNDGQNTATLFQKRAKDVRHDEATGRPWARQDYQGSAQITCPYCDCESLHWVDGGHEKLPSGVPIIDIKLRPKSVANLEKDYANRFNKAASMREQMAAEDTRNAERETAQVPVTTAEMAVVDRQMTNTRDMTNTSHGVHRPNIVDVQDKTLVDGQPLASSHVSRMTDEDIAELIRHAHSEGVKAATKASS